MSRRMKLGLGASVLMILVGVAPLVATFGAIAIADAHDCTLHEGFTNPCVVWGADRGETLYTMFVMGWFALLSLPVAVLGTALFAALLILHFAARGRAASPAP